MCVVNLQQQDVGEDATRKDQHFEALWGRALQSEVDSQLRQMKEEAAAQASVQMGLVKRDGEWKLQLTGLIAEKDAKMTAAQKDWCNQFNFMQVERDPE